MIKKKTLELTEVAVLAALIFILTFTPIGMIPLGPTVSATTVHIPTILGSILLGPGYGAALGVFMGVSSLVRALLMPTTLLDPLFVNPVISILPRIFVGIVPGLMYRGLEKFSKNKATESLSIGVSALSGTLTNTILVLGLLCLVYPTEFASVLNIGSMSAGSALAIIIGSIVAINGLTEVISAVAVSIPAVLALQKAKKLISK